MKIIGVTGGVGSGKSELLAYIKTKYNCRILMADEAAHKVKEPGQPCYDKLVALLSKQVLSADGQIGKAKMARMIFEAETLRSKVNALIHPAVKEYILSELLAEKEKGEADFFFLEAALLIECGYLEFVDQMWYIYADEQVRRERLKRARGYSDEKIDAIMRSQLGEAEYRANCHTVIDNSGSLQEAYDQIDRKLGEML